MERRWDCIYGRKNICPKQQEAQREDSTRESQLSRCKTSRITEDVRIDQTKLLVTRTKRKCQQNKVQHQKKSGELHQLEIPQGLW